MAVNNIKKKKMIKCLALVLAVILFSYAGTTQPGVGLMAKDIKLPDVNNQVTTISSLKGKVVLIDFWASWCRPCRQTVPGLKKLYSQYHNKGFEIYGVSLDENADAWKAAIQQDGSGWIHVNDKTGNVANQWVVSVIPTSFLLDKTGKIVAVDEEVKSLSALIPKLL